MAKKSLTISAQTAMTATTAVLLLIAAGTIGLTIWFVMQSMEQAGSTAEPDAVRPARFTGVKTDQLNALLEQQAKRTAAEPLSERIIDPFSARQAAPAPAPTSAETPENGQENVENGATPPEAR